MKKLQPQNKRETEIIAAAVKVRDMMLAKSIKAKDFNMNHWSNTTYKDGAVCGTAHCIGGWMHLADGGNGNSRPITYDRLGSLTVSLGFEERLQKLFSPNAGEPWKAKKKHAIQAIDNFLKGHKNPWSRVEF